MNRKRYLYLLVLAVVVIVFWNLISIPEDHFKKQIGEPVQFHYNEEIEKVKDSKDLSELGIQTSFTDVPAQDEILLQENLGRAFVASMDGFIWILDLQKNKAEQFVKAPLMPGGMVSHPKDPDLIYFCASRGKKDDPVDPSGPGIYELKISNKTIRKISTRVPIIPKTPDQNITSSFGKLYSNGKGPKLRFSEMNDSNSRLIEKADDLAISRDGERIYFTEPYDHAGAILGVSDQSRNEALTLGQNGNVWKLDLKENTASLVAYDYAYVDGILLEYPPGQNIETSILLNEVSKFRLLRLHLSGQNSGKDEVAIDGLPGFPDGMDRDPQGRVWVALVFERSKLVTWLHSHPFWKNIVLYIPQRFQPVSRKSGLLLLSEDGKKPLYYGIHNGSIFSTLIVVIPGKEKVFLSVYEKGYKGINTIPYPL
ncbi:hypothetical protein [Leptospira sarikeiensis]|uniref:SMP-30/gluconolaconase/LRE-like region n=1 Tax=Leptospira sarikeiensis TaxID=2484943 RepID=A0A4R9K7P5_9LEPT|nr:hypothetical protein [Leptospira sarikeiensis]TGL61380.1 hypothetical protein EHQ64_10350 [Leptospira sarikeiensis]